MSHLLQAGFGPVPAVAGGVLMAALGGLANGLLITGLRVMPFIVALGAMGIIRGALVGAMLMTEIKTGGTHLGLANWVQEIITRVIMIVAVALGRLRHRRGARG